MEFPRILNITTTLGIFAISLISCKAPQKKQTKNHAEVDTTPHIIEPEDSEELIKIQFNSSPEKQQWIHHVTQLFNSQQHKTAKGRTIFISQQPLNIEAILKGNSPAHLVSPPSSLLLDLNNAESKAQSNTYLVNKTNHLCLSPVVVAMWKPMAEALGHGTRAIGWQDIYTISNDPLGWSSRSMPQWGKFCFGHTNPQYSNSGLMSLIAETHACSGTQSQLTDTDIKSSKTGDYLESIEQSVAHYGKSTSHLGKQMLTYGPSYLSATVQYESMVIDSYDQDLEFPIVAIYPMEGTFVADHPIGIINRDWVTDEHKEACQIYINFLLSSEQQLAAMDFGLRPSDKSIPLSDKFSATFGVDKNQPTAVLQTPSLPIVKEIQSLWLEKKKKSHVVLAIDTSSAMKDNGKMRRAIEGAIQILNHLNDDDTLSLVTFNSSLTWISRNTDIKNHRTKLQQNISNLVANGETALYDAIYTSFKHLHHHPGKDEKISAVVILTGGSNTTGGINSPKTLLKEITPYTKDKSTKAFTIIYGSSTDNKILSDVAQISMGQSYIADSSNIKQIFSEIAAFF